MPTWRTVVSLAAKLPGVEESTWYGTPGLKVAGKGFARLRSEAEGGVVLMCSLDEKERLLASGEPYFTTPHYDGYGSVIVDLELIDRAELEARVITAWRLKAPAALREQLDNPTPGADVAVTPVRPAVRRRPSRKTR